MKKITHIVAGCGKVGAAVASLLRADVIDIQLEKSRYREGRYDVLHVCFPYRRTFVAQVRMYKKRFKPTMIIIHSTVPIGTSRKLNAVHSPIRGIHPHLLKSLKTFVKFFGGGQANKAARIFASYGVKTFCTESQENTEAMKLWDTTIYGVNILLEKEIFKFCSKYNLDFNVVYTQANKTYNEGYKGLKRREFQKYMLKHMPGNIGGHCIVSNARLLNSPSAKRLF